MPDGTQASSAVWHLAPDAQLLLRYWDDECVLYHGASGDTHRLPELVGRLLERLGEAPATIPELAEAIDLHEEDVAASLEEFVRLGIAEATDAAR